MSIQQLISYATENEIFFSLQINSNANDSDYYTAIIKMEKPL